MSDIKFKVGDLIKFNLIPKGNLLFAIVLFFELKKTFILKQDGNIVYYFKPEKYWTKL